MKVLVSLAMMFPLFCHASLGPTVIPVADDVFTCSKFTDNKVDIKLEPENSITTDNPVQDSVTEIVVGKSNYTIKPGKIFPKGIKLDSPAPDFIGTFATDKEAMVFQQENEAGQIYFLIFISPGEKETDKTAYRIVTVAHCDLK